MAQGDIWPTPEATTYAVTTASGIWIAQDPKIVFVYLYNLGSANIFFSQGQPAVLNAGLVIPPTGFIALAVEDRFWKWVGDTGNMISAVGTINVSAYICRRP